MFRKQSRFKKARKRLTKLRRMIHDPRSWPEKQVERILEIFE